MTATASKTHQTEDQWRPCQAKPMATHSPMTPWPLETRNLILDLKPITDTQYETHNHADLKPWPCFRPPKVNLKPRPPKADLERERSFIVQSETITTFQATQSQFETTATQSRS